jgi:cell volume regulation protein A
MEVAILAAGLFVFLAHLLDMSFTKTRVPDILVLMIIGVLAGPVLGWVKPEDLGGVGRFLSVVTLIVILCASGLELRFGVLMRAARRAVPFALFSMAGAVVLMAGLLHVFLGLDGWMSILGAFILGGTSSSVVIPMIGSLGTSADMETTLTVESALTDVLCIIATVGIATSLAGGDGVHTGGLVGSVAFSLTVAPIMGVGCALGWAFLVSFADRLKGAMHTTLAFALVIYGVAEIMGISGGIAVLAFGIALGNLPEGISLSLAGETIVLKQVTTTERAVYKEVVFLLKAFFFFYLGLTVRPGDFVTFLGVTALVLALLPFIARYPAVRLVLNRRTVDRREAVLAWALVPRGLAAAVLAQIPVQFELVGSTELAKVVAMMVFLSITVVAIFVARIEQGKLDRMSAIFFGSFPLPEGALSASTAADPGSEATVPDVPLAEAFPVGVTVEVQGMMDEVSEETSELLAHLEE